MKFYTKSGRLEIMPSLHLFPTMKVDELLLMPLPWEIWTSHKGVPISYRAQFPTPESALHEGLILIAFFDAENGKITSWDFGPVDGMEGPQNRLEGTYTKRIRGWFLKRFGVKLPQAGSWGTVDAACDPYNLTASVVCNYRKH